MKHYNVLSLFGGIECGRLAMERAGLPVFNYASSEVDKYAVKVSSNMWPGIHHIGDVRGVRVNDLGFIPDIIFAGFPCQGFSFAGKGFNFEDPRSQLFFEFVRILEECRELNPDVLFLGENVPMKKEAQMVISEKLGIHPTRQHGALVSAQNRDRLFWTNIKTKNVGLFGEVHSDIPQPKDKGIFLRDILENEVSDKYLLGPTAIARIERSVYSKPKINPEKSGVVTCKNNSGQLSADSGTSLIGCINDNGFLKTDINGTPKPNQGKADCFTAGANSGGNHSQMDLIIQRGRGNNKGGVRAQNGKCPTIGSNSFEQNNHVLKGATVRRLTPMEVCRLFTLPDDYFHKSGKQVVSDSQIYRLCGNGWIVDQVAHILTFIKN